MHTKLSIQEREKKRRSKLHLSSTPGIMTQRHNFTETKIYTTPVSDYCWIWSMTEVPATSLRQSDCLFPLRLAPHTVRLTLFHNFQKLHGYWPIHFFTPSRDWILTQTLFFFHNVTRLAVGSNTSSHFWEIGCWAKLFFPTLRDWILTQTLFHTFKRLYFDPNKFQKLLLRYCVECSTWKYYVVSVIKR